MRGPNALYTPSQGKIEKSNLHKYRLWVNGHFGYAFKNYREFHAWSISRPEEFWCSLSDYLEIVYHKRGKEVLGKSEHEVINPLWFPTSELSFAENLLQGRSKTQPALIFAGEGPTERQCVLSQAELYESVRQCAQGLRAIGVKPGDRVASWQGTIMECVITAIATSAVGAIWSSAAPEFGTDSILDRFVQIRPKVLVASNGVVYAGKGVSQLDRLGKIVAQLAQTGLTHCIVVPHIAELGTRVSAPSKVTIQTWSQLTALGTGEVGDKIDFWYGNFNAPLWVLYSSGSTGKPKAIIHRAGGILLKLKCEIALHADLSPGDRLLQFTTAGWMMFNFQLAALACGCTVVLRDGSPNKPKMSQLWDDVDKYQLTYLGISPKYLQLLDEAGYYPKDHHSLASLKVLGSTGSPLSAAGYDFVYSRVKSDIYLGNTSGGTDICSSFVGPIPPDPVFSGQVQGPLLGVAMEAWNDDNKSVVDEAGNLVCVSPLPCYPLGFWNDHQHQRFKESYFAQAKKADGTPVWYHGDAVEVITQTGGIIMHGRSDATLNMNGIRCGTAEVYAVLDRKGDPQVEDYLAIGHDIAGGEQRFILFVKLKDQTQSRLDHRVIDAIRRTIKEDLSPKHLPARVLLCPDIPYTSNGKKVELPVKKILNGAKRSQISANALRNPESLDFYFTLIETNGLDAKGTKTARL